MKTKENMKGGKQGGGGSVDRHQQPPQGFITRFLCKSLFGLLPAPWAGLERLPPHFQRNKGKKKMRVKAEMEKKQEKREEKEKSG